MRKYIFILLFLLLGLALLAFNRKYLYIFDSDALIMDIQLIGLGVILILTLLSLIPKLRKPKFIKSILVISILLISSEMILAYNSLEVYNRTVFTNNYHGKSCDELLERFEFDKTQNKFVYFSTGIGVDSEGIKLEFKEKYNVEVVCKIEFNY
ncbi:hypothetical protein [Brumimicrobium mesophilum]|uniref:hypothetical protein n=1 Tax=Brumimicrobium mesophilum TaxID=392717 RepID=UPI00131E09E9|nr:hypothetical protein [Brumimicrobium mesophilum]